LWNAEEGDTAEEKAGRKTRGGTRIRMPGGLKNAEKSTMATKGT